MKPWYLKAGELDDDSRVCTCCGKRLTGRARMLELDQRIDDYHDFGGVPENKSQGWFPFGPACAKNANAIAKKKLKEVSNG